MVFFSLRISWLCNRENKTFLVMKTIFARTIADFQRQSQLHEYGSGRSQLLSLDPDPDKVSASMIESNRFFLWSRMRQVGHSDTDPVFSKMLDDPDPDSVDLWPDKSANRVVRKSLCVTPRGHLSPQIHFCGECIWSDIESLSFGDWD